MLRKDIAWDTAIENISKHLFEFFFVKTEDGYRLFEENGRSLPELKYMIGTVTFEYLFGHSQEVCPNIKRKNALFCNMYCDDHNAECWKGR